MIRIAEIKQLQFVGQLGRIRVQFQDPASSDIENGVLLLPTGDNACPSVGDSCYVLCVGDEYGINYVIPYDVDNAPKILEGEKIIYGKKKNQIYFKQDGSISIATADDKQIDISAQGGVNITGAVNITGNVAITGNLSVSGTSSLQGTTTIETKPFISHTHSGVTTGAGNTGSVV
jgi:phage gp45-like